MRKCRQKIADMSMFFKLTLLFGMILIIASMSMFSYVSVNYTKILERKEIALGETYVERLANYISEKYNRIYSLANYIHSSEVSDILSRVQLDKNYAYQSENIKYLNTFFQGIMSADSDISDVILATKNGVIYSETREGNADISIQYDFMNHEQIKELLASDDTQYIVYNDPTEYALKERKPVISFIGKVFDASLFPDRVTVGIYIMNIPTEKVGELQGLQDEENRGTIYLLNSNQQILYSSSGTYDGTVYQDSYDEIQDGDYQNIRNIPAANMEILYVLSKDALAADGEEIRNHIVGGLVLLIGITIITGGMVYRTFSKRLNGLIKSMNGIQEGNFTQRIPVTAHDEIGKLSERFNEMYAKLEDYIGRVYIAEVEQKNAEISALMMQIDPHFLYNTLESIKSTALEADDEITAEMIGLLGKLFRWSSTQEHMVMLEDEIEYMETYLELQQLRYNGELEIEVNIEEDILDSKVPKLILQPIVENIFKHGFCHVREGRAGIVGKKQENGAMCITVFDDGEGMDLTRLKKVKTLLELTEGKSEGIGIYNVQRRIKKMFGEAYGLTIESSEGKGTVVSVILPIVRG